MKMKKAWTKELDLLTDMLIAKEEICEAWTIGISLMCSEPEHTNQMMEYLKSNPNATEDECVEMAYQISGYPRYKQKSS